MAIGPKPRVAELLAPISPRKSLSARLFWLVIGIVMLIEVAILMPSLARERQSWLWDHITDAHLAALSVTASGHAIIDLSSREELLRLSNTEAIRLIEPGRSVMILPPVMNTTPDQTIDLATESFLSSMWQSDLLVLGLDGDTQMITAPSPLDPSIVVEIVISTAALADYLRLYAAHIAALSAIIALVTGLIVFLSLDRWLVRRMRVLSAGIAAFRADPEHAETILPDQLYAANGDEIDQAGRELIVLQRELRAALWRNARLAALGTAVAKISHDLRNILASALLIADRLALTEDPAARRAAKQLIPAVERAADLVSRTLDFAREGPPPVIRTPIRLRSVIDEALVTLRPLAPGMTLDNRVTPDLMLDLDRTQMFRVLMNLMRNATEAGAHGIRIDIERAGNAITLLLTDDGPGLPEPVLANLFRPFAGVGKGSGTGLGLAIARDLVRAHGGDIVLRSTGPHGTVFAITLPEAEYVGGEAAAVK